MSQQWVETTASEDSPENAIDILDASLEGLERVVNRLEDRLTVVSKMDSEKELASPIPAPRSPLVGRAQRVSDAVNRIERIIYRLDI